MKGGRNGLSRWCNQAVISFFSLPRGAKDGAEATRTIVLRQGRKAEGCTSRFIAKAARRWAQRARCEPYYDVPYTFGLANV